MRAESPAVRVSALRGGVVVRVAVGAGLAVAGLTAATPRPATAAAAAAAAPAPPPATRPAAAAAVTTTTAPAAEADDAVVAGCRAMSASLARRLPEVALKEVGLSDVLDFFRDVTQSELVVDWVAVKAAGVAQDAPLTLRVENVKAGDFLDDVVARAGGGKLAVLADGELLMVTTRARADALLKRDRRRWMAPADLARPPADVVAVRPEIPASLRRRMPEFKLDNIAIADALDFVSDAYQVKIAPDWAALATVGVRKETPIAYRLYDVRLESALRRLAADPTGGRAAFYVAKDGTLKFTTRAAAEAAADRAVVLDE